MEVSNPDRFRGIFQVRWGVLGTEGDADRIVCPPHPGRFGNFHVDLTRFGRQSEPSGK